MKQNGMRLEKKTSSEITNTNQKMSSKDCSEVSSIKLNLNKLQCQHCKKNNILQSSKVCEQNHKNILASLKNNQSLYSFADFFVRFTPLRERKVSLKEEKSTSVSSLRIRVK